MSAADRYAPCLAAPDCIENFDTALGAIMSDRLAGRISSGQGVELEEDVRQKREEWIMRHGG